MDRPMEGHRFRQLISTEAELRELVGTPGELALRKQLSSLDQHCRAFIGLSPFLLIGTFGANGAADVSPRGDAPGFVLVLDDKTVAIPERPGNRRLDTLRNILQTSRIGLLFMVPGMEETLRVNGRACLTRDPEVLKRTAAQGKQPLVAIGVEVEECFLQCAKALKRSKLWDPSGWIGRGALPTLALMLFDQTCIAGKTVEDLAADIQESYAKRLY